MVGSSSALITDLGWVYSGSVASCLDEWGLPGPTKLTQLTLLLTLESHELSSRSAPVCSWAQENKKKCARPSEAQTWNQFNFASPILLVRNSDKASSDSRDGEKSPQRIMDFFFPIYLPNRSFMTSSAIFTSEQRICQSSYWQNQKLAFSFKLSYIPPFFLSLILLTYIPFYHTIFLKYHT